MKKKAFCCLLLTSLIALLCACGEYKGINNNRNSASSDSDSGSDTSSEEEFGADDGYFSVRLKLDGEVFTKTDGLQAQWSNGSSLYRANFGKDHVAKVSGLDGDYTVTIYGLPDGAYIYDPNVNVASSFNQDIEIDIYEYVTTRGKGTDTYGNAIKINRFGGYTAVLENPDDVVYYHFTPTRGGAFAIETIADITANEINPSLDIYNGSFAWNQYAYTLDTGGTEAEYTRNAKFFVNTDSAKVGNNYIFGVKATHREGVYPIRVNFLLKYIGEYSDPVKNKTIIIPDQAALAARGMIEQPSGTLTYPEVYVSERVTRFDGSMFALNEEDGVYHLYNEETGKYDGPILYAQITKTHRFFAPYQGTPVSFSTVENVGNACLTVENATENYKLFIEGGAAVVEAGVVGMENLGHLKGLADYIPDSNTYGVYPVTKEVQEFLQKFSISQRYFSDGNGWAETTAEDELGHRIYSTEDDQWLFACCYFV